MKDSTGNYSAGLLGLIVPSLATAGCMYALNRSLARPRAQTAVQPSLAEESA